MTDKMLELAQELKNLREEKYSLEAELKDLNKEIDNINFELSQLMLDTETQNFTVKGTNFCLKTITRASANKERKEQIEECNNELPSWLHGLVNVYEQTKVNLRKSK